MKIKVCAPIRAGFHANSAASPRVHRYLVAMTSPCQGVNSFILDPRKAMRSVTVRRIPKMFFLAERFTPARAKSPTKRQNGGSPLGKPGNAPSPPNRYVADTNRADAILRSGAKLQSWLRLD